MSEERGGIGEVGETVAGPERAPDVASERRVPRHVAHEMIHRAADDPPANGVAAVAPGAFPSDEVLAKLGGFGEHIAALHDGLEALRARLPGQDEQIVQLQGQVARIEAAFPAYSQAIGQLQARLDALAQQVMRNTRYAAMDLATRSRSPGEQAEKVVQNAQKYAEFIEPPAPPPTPPREPADAAVDDAPEALDGAARTTH